MFSIRNIGFHLFLELAAGVVPGAQEQRMEAFSRLKSFPLAVPISRAKWKRCVICSAWLQSPKMWCSPLNGSSLPWNWTASYGLEKKERSGWKRVWGLHFKKIRSQPQSLFQNKSKESWMHLVPATKGGKFSYTDIENYKLDSFLSICLHSFCTKRTSFPSLRSFCLILLYLAWPP